jgi:mannose-6-phosphate isomerase-like protein (cupin superfamily)
MEPFATRLLPEKVDAIAPDGSEIRELLSLPRGSFVHCTLPVGAVSQAVCHKTVEEIWYFLEGQGEVYRKQGDGEPDVTAVYPGASVSIPTGTHFQFRNTGDTPLRFVIVTMPPWPGADEAFPVANYWDMNR